MYNARWDDSGENHSTYFKRDPKSGENVLKDGYVERFIGSGDNVHAGRDAVATFTNDYDDMWDSYEPDRDKKTYGIYKVQQPAAPVAPAPEPKREPYKAPEQVGTSDKLANANQYLQNYTKSGKNFRSNTLSDRQAKTDSFSQKPAYDPNAGISSPEADNFLNDYKLDLQKNIKDFR